MARGTKEQTWTYEEYDTEYENLIAQFNTLLAALKV